MNVYAVGVMNVYGSDTISSSSKDLGVGVGVGMMERKVQRADLLTGTRLNKSLEIVCVGQIQGVVT